jgi:hypothetical protein
MLEKEVLAARLAEVSRENDINRTMAVDNYEKLQAAEADIDTLRACAKEEMEKREAAERSPTGRNPMTEDYPLSLSDIRPQEPSPKTYTEAEVQAATAAAVEDVAKMAEAAGVPAYLVETIRALIKPEAMSALNKMLEETYNSGWNDSLEANGYE